MRLSVPIPAAAACWCFPHPPMAWGPEGHEIVARIAADNLTPAAHLRMSQLLGGDAPP